MDWLEVAVERVVQETPLDRSFVLPLAAAQRPFFRFQPGQFVAVRDPDDPEGLQRHYTISTSPNEREAFELTVRDQGRFGDRFYQFEAGKRLRVSPPKGSFVLRVEPGDRLLLLAGGSGVAPYRSYVRFLREGGHEDPVTLLHSARTPEQLLFGPEMERHAAECAWFRYLPTVTRCTDDGWPGRRCRVEEGLLGDLVEDPSRTVCYACGPGPFVRAMVAAAQAVGLPPDRVRREQWTPG